MQKFVEQLQRLMRLQDWEIKVEYRESMEETGGVHIVFNDRKAVIALKAGRTKDEDKETVIHEMLHIITRDSYDIAAEHLEDDGFACKYYKRHYERETEQMAKMLFELLTGNRYMDFRRDELAVEPLPLFRGTI